MAKLRKYAHRPTNRHGPPTSNVVFCPPSNWLMIPMHRPWANTKYLSNASSRVIRKFFQTSIFVDRRHWSLPDDVRNETGRKRENDLQIQRPDGLFRSQQQLHIRSNGQLRRSICKTRFSAGFVCRRFMIVVLDSAKSAASRLQTTMSPYYSKRHLKRHRMYRNSYVFAVQKRTTRRRQSNYYNKIAFQQ